MQDLPLLAGSFLVTLAITPWVIRLARAIGWVDDPGHRKLHEQSMPLLGGLAILLGALPALIVLLARDGNGPADLAKVLWIVGASLAAGALGLFDDRHALRGRHKVIAQALIAIPFSIAGFRFVQLEIPALDPIQLGIWSVPLTVLWILTVCNAVNLIDGVDGLSLSVVATTLLGAAFCAQRLHDPTSMALLLAVLGAVLALLIYNRSPARIYLGDGGSLALGMFLATALLALGQAPSLVGTPLPRPGRWFFSYRIPLTTLLVIYPLLEIGLSAIRRAIKGRAIARADNDHIHHCLLRRSWSPNAIANIAALVTALAVGGVYARLRGFDTIASILWMLDGVVIGILLQHCGYLGLVLRSRLRNVRPAFRMSEHFASMQRLKLRSATSVGEVLALIRQACRELGVEGLQLRAAGAKDEIIRLSWPSKRALSELSPALSEDGCSEQTALRDSACWAKWRLFGGRPRDLEMDHRLLLDELIREAFERLRDPELILGNIVANSAVTSTSEVTCHALWDREDRQRQRKPDPAERPETVSGFDLPVPTTEP